MPNLKALLSQQKCAKTHYGNLGSVKNLKKCPFRKGKGKEGDGMEERFGMWKRGKRRRYA